MYNLFDKINTFSSSYKMIILFLLSSAFASYSDGYNNNPENYYRDPCPESRPNDLCNALVWC